MIYLIWPLFLKFNFFLENGLDFFSPGRSIEVSVWVADQLYSDNLGQKVFWQKPKKKWLKYRFFFKIMNSVWAARGQISSNFMKSLLYLLSMNYQKFHLLHFHKKASQMQIFRILGPLVDFIYGERVFF